MVSENILNQLFNGLKEAGIFSVQIDESQNIENNPQLMVFARFTFRSDTVEELLFYEPLKTTTGLNWNNKSHIVSCIASREKNYEGNEEPKEGQTSDQPKDKRE